MHNYPLSRDDVLRRLRPEKPRLATVSGVVTTRPGMIREVDERLPSVEVITTKSYQLDPNPGNREPVIVEAAVGNFGNAVGLRNPGMAIGIRELRALRRSHSFRALLNVSISGSSPEEFARLAEVFSEVADLIELNLSCPHAAEGYGMSIGTDPELVAAYVAAVRRVTDRPVFPKLTPNVDDIGKIARAAVAAGADGICAINTVGPELYIEPHSGQPILMNQRGNRGGQSGTWIAETARRKIAEVRAAVGPAIPIIGIGGVSSGSDLRFLHEAGAHIVGLGSVFARLKPKDWQSFTDALLSDADSGEHRAESFLIKDRVMEYHPYRVARVSAGGHRTVLLELEGKLEFKSSQFAFLWLPGVGEKPFSLAHAEPLTFFIKDRGKVSGAICSLQPGSTIYVRGVYGEAAPITDKPRAYILAGGTGIAVAAKLVQELFDHGTVSTVYYATSHTYDILLPPGIEPPAALHIVPDDDTPARAIRAWCEEIDSPDTASGDWALYTIGPPDFMRRAVEAAELRGTDPGDIFLSVETATHCGVGLCGECECGGRLTCQDGTFFSKKFLDDKGIKIADLPSHHSYAKLGVNN